MKTYICTNSKCRLASYPYPVITKDEDGMYSCDMIDALERVDNSYPKSCSYLLKQETRDKEVGILEKIADNLAKS